VTFVYLPFSVRSLDLFCCCFTLVKWGWLSLHDFYCSWHLYICRSLFGHSTFFVAALVCLKGTSSCVIRRNFKWNWAVRPCYGKVLQVIGLHDLRCYLLSLRGVWHLCVYALFWLVSIASYVFKSPSICFHGISLFQKSRKPLLSVKPGWTYTFCNIQGTVSGTYSCIQSSDAFTPIIIVWQNYLLIHKHV